MRRLDCHEFNLPPIQTFKSQQPKSVKDVLRDLKQKKQLLRERLKSQFEQHEPEQKNQLDSFVRDRIVTQIPHETNRLSNMRVVTQQSLEIEPSNIRSHSYLHTSVKPIVSKNSQSEISKRKSQQYRDENSSSQTKNQKCRSTFIPLTVMQKREHPPMKSRKEMSKEIEMLLASVPADPRERVEMNILQLKNYLNENNMFFAKVHNIISTCLLKLNRIVCVRKNQLVYSMGDERGCFYLILCGNVKLYNTFMKVKKTVKVCSAGESIGEELVFGAGVKKFAQESARTVTKCYLVEIKVENYKKVSEEMMKFGYKVAFHQMESILKRNFITKNWLRSLKARTEGGKP